jgi:death-on-curing protein
LESALVAVENRFFFCEQADVCTCGASYAHHLIQAHALLDGNKRVAAAITEIFIVMNGSRLEATDNELMTYFSR